MNFPSVRTVILCFLLSIRLLPGSAYALDFRTVVCGGKKATVCDVDLATDRLGLFWRDDAGQPLRNFDSLAKWQASGGKRLLFAMNAGMYEADFSPVGLFVSEGKQLVPPNLKSGTGNFYLKPNGVFVITGGGAEIVESARYREVSDRVMLATQSGPMLVIHGRVHPAFKPDSVSRLFRNGVGVTGSGRVIFAISDGPVNFYEFATLFRDCLKCTDALFLDGTVSSLYAPSLGRDDRKIDLGTMIGVVQ